MVKELLELQQHVTEHCLADNLRHRRNGTFWTVIGYFSTAATGKVLRVDAWAKGVNDGLKNSSNQGSISERT